MPAGDLVIRDPRALRALAHPVRIAILERLQGEGPATATTIGEVVGISASAASYHLRSLGAVRPRRRCRRWLGPQSAVAVGAEPDSCSSRTDHVGPAAEAAVQLLSGQLVARGEQETLAFIAAEGSLDPDWRAASHSRTRPCG